MNIKLDKITKIDQLKEGMQNVIVLAYVTQAYTFTTKKGDKNTRLIINDKSGNISAFLKSAFHPKTGNIIHARGNVGNHNGTKTLYITQIFGTYHLDQLPSGAQQHLFPALSPEELENIKKELHNLIEGTKDPEIKKLLEAVFWGKDIPDNLKNTLSRLWYYPAANKIHHARIGGLIQHLVKSAKLAEKLAIEYPDITIRDLVVAGALLHDIGKILEQKSIPGTGWTSEGELLGHIAMGYELIVKVSEHIKIDEEKITAIKHIILSHHGEKEKGSPVIPLTPEALIVHVVEDLDSHMDSLLSSAPNQPGKGETPNAFSKRTFFYHLGRDKQ